jgi:hypothetical protein
MTTTPTANAKTNEVTIFERLLSNGKDELSTGFARYLLTLGFSEEDKAHMNDLAARNRDGDLSAEEKEELLGYAKAGCLLGILQSKARKSLKKAGKNKAS